MAQLVNDILQDLGLLSATPGTFPELLTWLACSTIACALLAGVFRTLFMAIAYIRKAGR